MGHNSQEVEVEWQKYFFRIFLKKFNIGSALWVITLKQGFITLIFSCQNTIKWMSLICNLVYFTFKFELELCIYFVTSWRFESILSSILNVPQPYNRYPTKNRFYKDIEMSNRTTWSFIHLSQQMTTKSTERPLNMKTSNIVFQFIVLLTEYSHANITICIEELHLGARLNPAHGPCLVSGNRGHHYPGRCSEVRGLVSQDNGRILLNDGRALVNGGWDLIDHYVLPSDAGLAGDALNATHGPAY